MTRWSYFR